MTLIAVTGASGKLGRLIVERLVARQAGPIVALSRKPDQVKTAESVTRRYADFDDPACLVDAFKGVSSMVLISTDALGQDGRRQRQHMAAIDAARAAGIAHIVYTSVYKADCSPMAGMVADHIATEAMLARSGMASTVLRNAFYDELAWSILARANGDGVFPHAVGDAAVAYVSREDCAEAAACAVSGTFGGQRIFDITGPQALTMDALATLATQVRQRPYRAEVVSSDVLIERLRAGGMAEMQARIMAMIDRGLAAGAMAPASNDFHRLVGRNARMLTL